MPDSERAKAEIVVSRGKIGTLLDPRNGRIVPWTPEMFDELDRCVMEAATVQETMRRIGVEHATLARGAMLRLRSFLALNKND